MFEFKNMLHDEFTGLTFQLTFLGMIFLLGICIGSFLNVVIIRLPRGESLIKRSSHCMTCGTRIRPIDMIPVFSWLFLRGKCHSCGEKISTFPKETISSFCLFSWFPAESFSTKSPSTVMLLVVFFILN